MSTAAAAADSAAGGGRRWNLWRKPRTEPLTLPCVCVCVAVRAYMKEIHSYTPPYLRGAENDIPRCLYFLEGRFTRRQDEAGTCGEGRVASSLFTSLAGSKRSLCNSCSSLPWGGGARARNICGARVTRQIIAVVGIFTINRFSLEVSFIISLPERKKRQHVRPNLMIRWLERWSISERLENCVTYSLTAALNTPWHIVL